MNMARRPILTLGLLLAACSPTALPGTPVTSLADSGPGSLRDTLAGARDGDTLRFTTTGTVPLTSPLMIDKDVTVILDGVVLDAGGNSRVLEVAADADATVQGGTLTGGQGRLITLGTRAGVQEQATSLATYGGVILTAGTLTLSGTTVTGGTADNGGGIAVLSTGKLTLLDDALVTANTAPGTTITQAGEYTGTGGGVFNMGQLIIDGGHVDANQARRSGGGIQSTLNTVVTLKSGSVSSNEATEPLSGVTGNATGSAGGGIYTTGALDVHGGTISNNTASYFGGGVVSQAHCADTACVTTIYPIFAMSGGTVEGNKTTGSLETGGGGLWLRAQSTITGGVIQGNSSMYGGGVNTWGALDVTGGTIQNNTATQNGGGVSVNIPQGTGFKLTFGGAATIKNNTAANAGGGLVLSRNTTADITGGSITGNSTTGPTDGGGGIRVLAGAVLNLAGGDISGNTSTRTGGGLTVNGTVNMTGGTISGNTVLPSAAQQGGGGVRLYAGSKMTASGGVIRDNRAPWGAGVQIAGAFQANPAATFTLSGATVSGNVVTDPSNNGGGFFNDGSLTITSGTVTQNTATLHGGGIFNLKTASYAQAGGSVNGNTPDNVYTVP